MENKTLTQALSDYAQGAVRSFHMPGHKRRSLHSPQLPWALDITEIDGFDDLHDPQEILAEGMERAAALWGSSFARFLVNGTTGGILAALHAVLPRGSTVLVTRNCHKSIYHALELLDAVPVYLQPPTDFESGLLSSLPVHAVEKALDEHPETRAVMLVCPTYDGVLCDLPSIVSLCHNRRIPIIVDGAHGAHLGFGNFPAGAISAGCDIVVHSLHKTLPSLTQTALLQAQGNLIDFNRLHRSLGIFQSSSPSYPLMASLDGCVDLLAREGALHFARWSEALAEFDRAILPLKYLKVFCHGKDTPENHPGLFGYDPSKIVISTRGTSLTGPALTALLRQRHFEPEMETPTSTTAMTGLGTTREDLLALAEALLEIDSTLAPAELTASLPATILPHRVLPAGQALEQTSYAVLLSQSVGQIAAEYLWAYPPGIPLIVPGEKIGPDFPALCAAYEASGVHLKHTSHTPADTIQICAEMT